MNEASVFIQKSILMMRYKRVNQVVPKGWFIYNIKREGESDSPRELRCYAERHKSYGK
jgi:hypothetical protein